MSTVSIKALSKKYGNLEVVKDFNLEIKDGEFISLLGPSGCGKTTCLRMVAGLEFPTTGQIFIDDFCVNDTSKDITIPPEKRSVGMVFQSYAVWPHMNVFDNVCFPLKLSNMSDKDIKDKTMEVLEIVEMSGLEHRMPNQLSGGQQQRVALARGLVMEPKVLLLDEPLSNLDAKLRAKMRVDIRKIQQQMKITVIYVTHDQIEAFEMSDRMVIMNQGNIEQIGEPAEVRENPSSQFVKEFID